MYKCKFYTIKYNKNDSISVDQNAIKERLDRVSVQLVDTAELPRSAAKLADIIKKDMRSVKYDMFIVSGLEKADDIYSFRKLFYALIRSLEADILVDGKDIRPKIKVVSVGDLGNGQKGYCFNYFSKRFIILPDPKASGKDIPELAAEGIEKADEVFESKREKYPEGAGCVDKKGTEIVPTPELRLKDAPPEKKKQNFFVSFIPWKGDSKGLIARKVIVLVAIVAFIAALSYVLYFLKFGPEAQIDRSDWIQSIAYGGSESDESGGEAKDGKTQDWKALKKVNSEIVGWLKIPDTVIDYPVLEHKGDDQYYQYYIDHSYKKDGTEYGSIFLDYRSKQSTKSKNVVMHGHNMRDGSQFHSLLSYSPEGSLKGDLSYYRKHPVITFNTPDGDAKYKIISVFKTSTRFEHGEFFNYMQGEFSSDAEFMNFVYNMRIRSMFDIPVTVNEDDQIITLSTCCYEFWQWRCVVVARKVRPGEDESVDVQLASLNPSPLFPDVYYWSNGTERPDPLTFQKANKKGLISWYDGKGKLEGSEDLTATIAANPTQPPTEKGKPAATNPPAVFYQVIYRNVDGSQYAAYTVREGDPVPTPEGTPVMEEDDYYIYRFDGWNKNISGVDFDHLNVSLEIYPSFTPILK